MAKANVWRAFDSFVKWQDTEMQIKAKLILLDIDKFKNVNDIYGHDVGDEVLIEVANKITQQYQRVNDFIARVTGEGLVFVLTGTGMERAKALFCY
ncbi:diguanylate cyclase domain-containing protein [Pseudoalteromonas luteoviolacea]|uniref:diguanylate cyclase n=1 Tax=Pseudoalteromonas luteoviolacea NCIMB 1942 TaxID=1365253 RepID=A0A167HPG8_9GAMM|nr:diguanylate cyclase [Pseudoalteromonas luteoviolacea]KZN58357.1 hypothetical protein N482_22495 [Pseudoalteromonas luteoviolacea NCIMB 1942]KZW98504.1 hypothetical protein JL49_22945 [Pseudoalteromonas luteoviolacea]